MALFNNVRIFESASAGRVLFRLLQKNAYHFLQQHKPTNKTTPPNNTIKSL